MGLNLITHELLDPFGGESDLDPGILRHVSNKFSEDPMRPMHLWRQRFSMALYPSWFVGGTVG